MSGEKGITLSYKNNIKQFYISRNTQSHRISALLKKSFHLTSDIKVLKHPRGYYITLADIFNFNLKQPFEIITQQDTSEDKSRSQTYSQKALTKRSGRKYPAQQKQLNDAKFYIDDFQFFMQQFSAKHQYIFIGIIFFNSKKTAGYLGKKILRELIFQFDQLQFFFGLHPLKRHSKSTLLGETLIFTLFQGRKMINEREFPQNLSAIEQISGYLKCLIKNGQLPEAGEQSISVKQAISEKRNLIKTNEQRSFDAKAQNDLRTDQFDHVPQILNKAKTIDKVVNNQMDKSPPVLKFDSPIKSQLGNQINQISFENQFYQPDWFIDGDKLNRMQKSLISALTKCGDADFTNFCHSLDLRNKEKQNLNLGLIRVFIQNYLNKKLSNFTEEQFSLLELNIQNRQSFVFSLLLKLNKFGNIDDFITTLYKQINTLKKYKCSYVQLAREIEKKRNVNFIRLKGCDSKQEDDQQVKIVKLAGKDSDLDKENIKIANFFHRSPSLLTFNTKNIQLPEQFDESQKAVIKQLILQKDPFLVQNYIPSKWSKKKFTVFTPKIIRKYLKDCPKRFQTVEQFPFEERIKLKFTKLKHYSNLLYYLYKQRTINKKQKIGFLYLYIWSDLNVLGCYEFYLFNRNLQEFIQTMYTLDYTYYHEDKYGLEMNQIQHLTVSIEQQLIIIFLLGDLIENTLDVMTLEKFIRAGDNSVWQAIQSQKSQTGLLKKLKIIAEQKRGTIERMNNQSDKQQKKLKVRKEDMKKFVSQIKPVHFKTFKEDDLINDCIELDDPLIHGIFEVYYQTNQIVEWIDSFSLYILKLKEIHMDITLKNIAKKYTLPIQKLVKCRTDLIKGVYEVYMIFKNQEDAAESLERIISKPSSYS